MNDTEKNLIQDPRHAFAIQALHEVLKRLPVDLQCRGFWEKIVIERKQLGPYGLVYEIHIRHLPTGRLTEVQGFITVHGYNVGGYVTVENKALDEYNFSYDVMRVDGRGKLSVRKARKLG